MTTDHAQNLRDLIAKRRAGVVRKIVRHRICLDVEVGAELAEVSAERDEEREKLHMRQMQEKASDSPRRITDRGTSPRLTELEDKYAELVERAKAASFVAVFQGLDSEQHARVMAEHEAGAEGADLDRPLCQAAFVRWETLDQHPVDMDREQALDMLTGLLNDMSRGEVRALGLKVGQATLDPLTLPF